MGMSGIFKQKQERQMDENDPTDKPFTIEVLEAIARERERIRDLAEQIQVKKLHANLVSREERDIKEWAKYALTVRKIEGQVRIDWVRLKFNRAKTPEAKWRVNYQHVSQEQVRTKRFSDAPEWEKELNREINKEVEHLRRRIEHISLTARRVHAYRKLEQNAPLSVGEASEEQDIFKQEDPLKVRF